MKRCVLLIEPDSDRAAKITIALAGGREPSPSLEWVGHLADGFQRLKAGPVDAVLVDVSLTGSRGLETFDELLRMAADAPILVICDPAKEPLALQIVERGARDYILTTHLDAHSLRHAIGCVVDGKAAADILFAERNRAKVILNSIADAVLSTDHVGNVTYLNPVAERMTGWSLKNAEGHPLKEVFNLAHQERAPTGSSATSVLIRRDGVEAVIEDSTSPMHDRQCRATGSMVVFRDLSAARAMTLKMSHLAYHDRLTDLPNRLLLHDRLGRAVELAGRHRRSVAVLVIDLDGFKQVNDALGHDAGDELLRSVSKRITGCLRSSDTISRPDGDEFVVVLSETDHASSAAVSARKILAAIAERHWIGDHGLQITASIGITVYPIDGQDAETLVKRADMAMHQAKKREHGGFQFFHPEMNATAVERLSIERGLRRALDCQEFVLHYQPIVEMAGDSLTGAEALVRWQHPDWGLLPPSWFIPIAEDSGLIVQIGRWVLREACRQSRAWHDAGLPTKPVAVNVSAIEFRSAGFAEGVRQVLEETGLPPDRLGLELTETVLMARGPSTLAVLQELKAIGVTLSLDDFGTGFSSLSNLKEFPIDALKVDQSFVRAIGTLPKGAPIVRSVIALGQSLSQRVIAEGVETAEEAAFLRNEGCDEAQGFYFGPPLTAEQYAKLSSETLAPTSPECRRSQSS